MVLDTAKLKNKKSTIWPGMRGRDAARRLTLKVNIYRYSRSISQRSFDRESQLAIGWAEQKCKEMDELAKENLPSLYRGILKNTKDNGISP